MTNAIKDSPIQTVETKVATAIRVDNRYVGCYYFVEGHRNDGATMDFLRVFNRRGDTTLKSSLADVYEWLGVKV